MLASVEKLVDKTFVIGFLLPAILAVYTALNVFHCARWFSALCEVQKEKPFENLTYVALAVWVLAVLLLSLNHVAYRFLEGYVPPISHMQFLRDRHRRRLAAMTARARAATGNEAAVLASDLRRLYPTDEDDVLPTTFGNVIRAFEVYPWDVYRADGVVVWERLQTVIPSGFQQSINEARSQADFYVNVAILSSVLGVAAALKLLEERIWDTAALAQDAPALWAMFAVGLIVAWCAYRMSIGPLMAWGDTVKSAFDCYLPALIAQLGYEPPATESKRRDFWDDMDGVFSYRELLPDGRWPFMTKSAKASEGKDASGGGGSD